MSASSKYPEVEPAELHHSPDGEKKACESMRVVDRALAELPRKCRRALLLQSVYGLNRFEIAEHLGIQEGLVELHLARALEHLRRCMDGADHDPQCHQP